MVAFCWLDAVLTGIQVLDFGKAQLQVSLLCIGTNSIDGTLALREDYIIFFISEEGWSHYFMDIFLILAYRLTLLKQFLLKKLFVLILFFRRLRLRRRRLHLTMYDLINRHVGVLILILLLRLLLVVKLIPLYNLLQLFIIVRIMLGVVLQSHLHVLHAAVKIADLPNLLLFAL